MPDASPDDVVETPPRPAAPPSPQSGAPPVSPRPVDFAAAPLAPRDAALILVQLALCAIVVWQFQLEEKRHLLWALLAALGGFLVNIRLPPRWRPAWFTAVSVACLAVVLGPQDALFALSVAGALLAAALLPVSFIARAGLLVLLAAACIWQRSSSIAPFWPIVGSMFMFRTISYLQAVRKERAPRSLAETASYFLMFPNVFFPLFPVIDARTFRDCWYNADARTIYQTGVHWIATGLLHLGLYRVVKYELLPSPLAVRTLSDAFLYLAMNYALYLRVSGHFHLVCGMLHLFGWNLPRTHDHYFLAASFSEIWRRINIYWKDFLMKTFFYPAYFQLRGPLSRLRYGEAMAIATAVMWVFFWTWLAHSWQTFWILGRFPFLLEHGITWLVVGLFVAVNSVVDYRRAVRTPAAKSPITAGELLLHSFQVIGMFLLVATFWGLWSNRETFLFVMQSAAEAPWRAADAFWILSGMLVLGTAAAIERLLESQRGRVRRQQDAASRQAAFQRSASRTVATMTVAVIVAIFPADHVLPQTWAAHWRDLRKEQTTVGDALANIDGYYEQLNDGSLQAGPYLLRGDTSFQEQFAGEFLSMVRPRRDIQLLELIPGWQGEFNGAKTTVNRWGMRDKPRTLAKSPGTRRVAVVGSSVVMGLGVDDDHTITQELERLLNASADDGTSWEVLNFGMGRSYAVERRAIIEHKVLAFQPDVILYVAHQDEYFHTTKNLGRAFARGIDLEDPNLDKLTRDLSLSYNSTDYEIESGFSSRSTQVLELTYQRLNAISQESGTKMVFVYLPIPGNHPVPSDPTVVMQMAEAGGLKSIDLTGWWGTLATEEVVGAMDQFHPRKVGTRLIATTLFNHLAEMRLFQVTSQP